MSYIEKNLLSDEQILFRTKKSVWIFFYPVLLALFSLYVTGYLLDNPILQKIVLAPWIVTAIFGGYVGFEYAFSEYAVTNKRVMMREGFFTRHANETRLSAISQVNVEQTLLGMLLNYGTVSLNAFGAYDSFPMITKPFLFQKAVNQQMDQTRSGQGL